MSAALTTILWLACIFAIVPTLAMAMGIKFQEDREAKGALAGFHIVEGASYLRRYRFLWASMPMSFLLLGLVALPTFVCGPDGNCESAGSQANIFILSLALGLVAWSLTISLLYNRYFHSQADHPFRALIGTERLMWVVVRLLSIATIVLAVVAAIGLL